MIRSNFKQKFVSTFCAVTFCISFVAMAQASKLVVAVPVGVYCTSSGCNAAAAPCALGGCKRETTTHVCGCRANPSHIPGDPNSGTACYCHATKI
jgi:hypothetical protein